MRSGMLNSLSPVDELEPRGRVFSFGGIFQIQIHIARNRGHFAPVINCQRHLIFKMADKNIRSQGKRVP